VKGKVGREEKRWEVKRKREGSSSSLRAAPTRGALMPWQSGYTCSIRVWIVRVPEMAGFLTDQLTAAGVPL